MILSHFNEYDLLTFKGLIVFFEFKSRSYGMNLEPNFFIFLGLILFFDIYLGM